MKRLNNFDFIRGFSCIFICLNHTAFFNTYWIGAIGVEYFIIISGFLTSLNASRHIHLRQNYIFDKLKKIMPLYWIATFVVFFIGLIKPNLFSNMIFNISSLLKSLFLIPGNTFYIYPGWTLTYFFIFYLIYFLSDKSKLNRDVIATVILVIVSFIGMLGTILKIALLINWCNPILIEFAYGIILQKIFVRYKVKFNNTFCLGCAILFLIIGIFNINEYLGPRYLVPSFIASISIYFFSQISMNNNILYDLIIKIGKYSFFIYILHPLFIRPFDKLLLLLTRNSYSVLYFIGVFFEISFTILICIFINKIFHNSCHEKNGGKNERKNSKKLYL